MFGRCWKEQNLSTSTNQLSILQGESYMAIYIYTIYLCYNESYHWALQRNSLMLA